MVSEVVELDYMFNFMHAYTQLGKLLSSHMSSAALGIKPELIGSFLFCLLTYFP